MVIEDSKVVSIHYTLKNEEGEVLGRSPEDKPLTYMQGTKSIIPGLEKELAGREDQEEFSVEVKPEEGYGPVHPQLISVIDRKAFQGVEDIQPGMQFQARDDKGNTQIITVKSVEGDKVTVDRNHPLAGKTLHFDIKVESVREPTEEELENAPKPE
mgnify:FL=1